MTSNVKILITGSEGQLGLELKRIYRESQQSVFFLSKNDCDTTNIENLEKVLESIQPQFIINCAAYTNVENAESEKELAYKVNFQSVKNLGLLSKKYLYKIIQISTDYVFDGTSLVPYEESFETGPLNYYGHSKLLAEEFLIQNKIPSIILRTSWVYSPYKNNFVKTMAKLLKEKNEINVVNDQIGSPTYAHDLAYSIKKIVEEFPRELYHADVYHYSNHGQVSWFEFAKTIKELTGSKCKIKPVTSNEYIQKAQRPHFTVLNTKKFQHTFNLPINNWKESLEQCLSRMKEPK